MFDHGDILLFALSAWRQTGWTAFKKAFDELYRLRVAGQDSDSIEPVQFVRARTMRILVALGHCDIEFNEGPRLFIAPPALVAVPEAGLPRAVLCGSRSPATIPALQRICRESQKAARLSVYKQDTKTPYAPTRVEIEAESDDALQRCADAVQVPYLQVPAAWVIAEAAGSIADYVDQLSWSAQPEVNWQREDFDRRRLGFQSRPVNAEGGVRLSRYLDPVRLRWEYRLVKENISARVNPDWARYVVLNASGQQVLLYDSSSGSVAVPRSTPLPNLLARVLTLCSGRAAEFLPARSVRYDLADHFGFDFYRSIPPDVFACLRRKLGHDGGVQPLVVEDEA